MNVIYYQTKTQFENTGDILINNALINELRKYGKLKCYTSKNIPVDFINELGILNNEKINCKNNVFFSLEILRESIKGKKQGNKVYVFSGLGHQWGGNIKANLRVFLSSIIFMIFKLFGIKIIKIGASIGPVTKGMAIVEKFRSNFVDFYYVRDTKSYELCQKLGIKKAKICPDMSWIYLEKHREEINESNIITVNLRESILNEKNENYQERLIDSTDIVLKELSKYISDMKVYFIYQVKRDREFSKKCYEHFKNKYNCYLIEEQILLTNSQDIYSKSVFNLSSRLHSLLLGYKYGSLPLAIIDKEKHIKISQTFIDCKLDSLIFDINERNVENLNTLIQNKKTIFNELISVEKEKRKEVYEVLNTIMDQ